jgi:hypothetical protein
VAARPHGPTRPRGAFIPGVRVLAAVLALFAVILMVVAVGGMVTGRPCERVGWVVRFLALLCFGAAVALNVAAH